MEISYFLSVVATPSGHEDKFSFLHGEVHVVVIVPQRFVCDGKGYRLAFTGF